MSNPTEPNDSRQPDQVAPSSGPPTDRELQLARGLLAIFRTHEAAGEPESWTVDPAPWGDGRTTFEVHGNATRSRWLVCQFRPDDADGTERDANACINAARVGLRDARAVVAETVAWSRECDAEHAAQRAEDLADLRADAVESILRRQREATP
jgi:hypothetical protein